MNELDNCSRCRFWVCASTMSDPHEDRGWCMRFPPTYDPKLAAEGDPDEGVLDFYDNPRTIGWNWCGEFKDKPKLSTRTENVLLSAGIKNVVEVRALIESRKLRRVPNIGNASIKEIEAWAYARGATLRSI
jgi:DNA-directed RNA polymerase alpha subunit